MALDYFYDGQFRHYMLQVIRVFSGFQHEIGRDANNNPILKTVPCNWAPQDKLVAAILKNNSENTILSTPNMSVHIRDIEMAPERRQNTNHVSTLGVHEREIDRINNRYTSERGASYTVERFMPVPFNMTVQLDIWTSNLMQKFELLEQILVLFNPALDIQTNTNALDWTALTWMELTNIVQSSRTIPIGTDLTMDIASLTFKVPIWINPPAKVKNYRAVEQIVTNISALNEELIEENADIDRSAVDWARGDIYARSITTPGQHHVEIEGNRLRLLGENSEPLNNLGEPWNWINLFELYGKYRPGTSQIRLKTTDDMDDHETDVIGTIQVDPTDPSYLFFNVDIQTLPANNLPPINGVIDPHRTFHAVSGPPAPSPLPTPQVGDRYIVINDIAPNTTYGALSANANDIIEFGANDEWFVAFDSDSITGNYTLVNQFTNKQLSWRNKSWTLTLAGVYGPGYWRVAL